MKDTPRHIRDQDELKIAPQISVLEPQMVGSFGGGMFLRMPCPPLSCFFSSKKSIKSHMFVQLYISFLSVLLSRAVLSGPKPGPHISPTGLSSLGQYCVRLGFTQEHDVGQTYGGAELV